ncbi:MAG TPA: aminotransferase class V-fold PLP-dependent enzyme [Candidatus Omnitrophota bacterium]|nr:aminotransferase class V-fold PLP-dependent enzyme [Candidatus Omnitrophota bacterium]HQO58526.1 aminotransferase class V-fold PLP-dependent enzyme [Candidatus Omnitrophota bacterium]
MLKKYPKRNIWISKTEFFKLLAFLIRPGIKGGAFVQEFENRFKKYVGTQDAIAVSSGRFALYLILKSLGLKKGDAILLSAYNFIGVPQSLLQDGYEPVFVDADPKTYQMDFRAISSKITQRTKAIIATHLFGQLCDISQAAHFARKHNLFLIEDAAQALGSRYNNIPAGTISDIGFFSFTGSKLLNTSYGGMIVTNDQSLGARIRDELSHYPVQPIGFTFLSRLKTYLYALVTQRAVYGVFVHPLSRLLNLCGLDVLEVYKKIGRSVFPQGKRKFNDMQALIGLMQMTRIERNVESRKTAARRLIARLDPAISIQHNPPGSDPCYFMIPLKTKNKDLVYRHLLARGIDTNLQYASDCSGLTGSQNLIAENSARSILTLNLPLDLKEEEILYVAHSINSVKNLLT